MCEIVLPVQKDTLWISQEFGIVYWKMLAIRENASTFKFK